MNKTKMHHRRNTLESIKELKKLPSINSLSINKAEDEEDYMPPAKEEAKVRGALENLQQDKPSTKGIFSRIYSIPSQDKMESSKRAMKSGQVPNTVNVYGSHYPVVRLLGDDTVLVHTSQYGNDGKTEELLSKIATHLPDIFPNHKIIEINHPDYTHSAKIMRMGNPKHIADYLQRAAQNHPDENYRLHAQDAHEHLTKMKKGQFTKPIHGKRMAAEGWDADKNMSVRLDRLHKYLTSLGLNPDTKSEGGRNLAAVSPTSITINKDGDPHDQQVVHEAAHAMLTPPKSSVKEYQQFIGKPGLMGKLRATAYRDEMKEMHGGGMPEQTTHHMEAGIRRRAGVEPFRSPERGANPKSAEEQSRKFAKEKLQNFDEGLESFDPFTGENTVGSSANALINAKVRVKKDPSSRNKGMFENVKNAFKQRKEAEKKMTSYDDMDLAASEKDVNKSSLEHPRDYYKRQKEQKQKEAAAEKKRLESGAKKPLDAAMEKLKIQNPPEIKKGENGDWKKEGYTLHHEAWNDDRPNFHPKTHDFKVTTKDKEGKVIGSASFTHENKKIAPVLSLVNKEHRRKGIASGMYEHAQNLSGKKVKPSDQQSLDAKKLWEGKDRKFGKSENDLAKGSFQSKNKTSKQKMPKQDLDNTSKWLNATSGVTDIPSPQDRLSRNMIGKQPKEFLNRLNQKIGSLTQIKRHPQTGELHALLHRAMSQREFDKYHKNGILNHHDTQTSWTTDKGQADAFANDYDRSVEGEPSKKIVASAWAPLSSIVSAPFLIPKGNAHKTSDIYHQASRKENEIILKPNHNSILENGDPKPPKDTLGERSKSYKGARWNRKMITNQMAKDKLAASEDIEDDLAKGSLQRRNPFNPMSKEAQEIKNKQREWTHDENDNSRIALPKIKDTARLRALNKLTKQTQVRKHPETGERMFLMHRGMGHEEFHGANKNSKTTHEEGTRTSWTPKLDVANDFGKEKPDEVDYDRNNSRVVSAWIPESSLIHSPNQFNAPRDTDIKAFGGIANPIAKKNRILGSRNIAEKEEHEWIVEHGSEGFHHANLDALAGQNKQDNKINSRAGKSGDKASYRAKSLKQLTKPDTHQGQYGWMGEQKLAASEKIQTEALCPEALDNDLQKPFKSKAQRAYLYAHPEKIGGKKALKEWESKTPKNIPKKVKKNKK